MLESVVPKFAVALQPFGGFGERLGFEPAWTALPITTAGDEPGAFQHFQVLGNGGLTHSEWLGQLQDRSLAGCEPSQDCSARGIGKRGEDGIELIGAGHLHNL